jgi:acetoacetate decarboxylase
MNQMNLRKTALAMPPTSPAFPPGPYSFVDRQYFIIRYHTDLEALRRVVPEPLEVIEPVVNYEFILRYYPTPCRPSETADTDAGNSLRDRMSLDELRVA